MFYTVTCYFCFVLLHCFLLVSSVLVKGRFFFLNKKIELLFLQTTALVKLRDLYEITTL